MPNVPKAFVIIATVLGVHGIAIASGWYLSNLWLDIPMHFAGGFGMGYLALAIWQTTVSKISFRKSLNKPWRILIYLGIILGFVALVGIAWEWYEFIFDSYASQVSLEYRPAQMSLTDTMADLFLDLLGGVLAFTLYAARGTWRKD